jgi:hypothetical protein
VDIDGTLVGEDRTISTESKEALARVCDLGIRVSLSTGRSIQACLGILDQLSLDGYHISFDGALVNNPSSGEEVYAQSLSRAVVKQAIEFARLNEIYLELFSATDYFVEQESWSTAVHREFFDIEATVTDFNEIWERERIIKGGLVSSSPQEAEKARSFCLHFDDNIRFSWASTPAYPDADFINIVDPEVSKGRALKVLASYQGVSMSETIAVGDGINDISLLSSAGLAIAMGNAVDEVKAVADYVTLDVNHNGLSAAIKKFLC